jgi:hypothetical protein
LQPRLEPAVAGLAKRLALSLMPGCWNTAPVLLLRRRLWLPTPPQPHCGEKLMTWRRFSLNRAQQVSWAAATLQLTPGTQMAAGRCRVAPPVEPLAWQAQAAGWQGSLRRHLLLSLLMMMLIVSSWMMPGHHPSECCRPLRVMGRSRGKQQQQQR